MRELTPRARAQGENGPPGPTPEGPSDCRESHAR